MPNRDESRCLSDTFLEDVFLCLSFYTLFVSFVIIKLSNRACKTVGYFYLSEIIVDNSFSMKVSHPGTTVGSVYLKRFQI